MDLAEKPRKFEDSWRRIDRAIIHARAVTTQWPHLLDPSAQPKIVHREDGKYAAQVRVKRNDKNDFSLELGEFFYQLRASLDAVAYKAVILEMGIDPPQKEDNIEFPIYIDSKRFDKCPFIMLTQFPKMLRDWLESIQPYKFAHSPDPDIVELGRRLKVLHDCARKDRHRRLHVVVAGISSLKASFDCTPNVNISNVRPVPIDFLGDDVDFLTFDGVITDRTQDTRIRLRTDVTVELGMMEFPHHTGQDLIDELERVMNAARHVVQVFEDGYRS
jgi:hypothetical protein